MKRRMQIGRNDRHFLFQGGLLLCAAIFSLLFIMAVDSKAAAPSTDYPSRSIEFVAPNAAGSSTDMFARLLSDIFQKEEILNRPLVVVNKPGSGGAVAAGYLIERKGNPHLILITGSTFVTTPLLEKVPYTYKTFTPIANMAVDGSVLVVRSDSRFKTADDIIAEAMKKPNVLNQGGSSFTGFASMMGQSIQKTKGVKWNFVPFKSGAEALMSLLGGHVDFAFADPTEVYDHVQAGKLRVLLAGAPIRYQLYKDVPTIKEAGMGEAVMSYRGIVGPPDMPDYAVKKLEAAFNKLSTVSPRFKQYLGETTTQSFWLSSQEYGKFLAKETDRWKTMLGELGLLK